MKKLIKNFIRILIVSFLGASFIHSAENVNANSNSYLESTRYWKFRWGDSPKDTNGNLIWLQEKEHNNLWNEIDKPSQIHVEPNSKNLWLKLKLNEQDDLYSAILVMRVEKIFEVYLDSTKIYSFGDFFANEEIPLMGFAWHLIKLPDNLNNKTLYFRIRSDYKYIGVVGSIRFGSEKMFLNEIVKSNLSKTILGVVFVFSGLVLLVLLFFNGKVKPFIGTIVFVTTSGVWTLANSNLTQIIFYAPKVIYYADHLALFSSAIGFFMLVVEIIDAKYKRIFKWFYKIIFIYLLFVVFIDSAGLFTDFDTVAPFLIVTSLFVLILFYFILLSARKGNSDARIFLIALIVYAVFALLDIVRYFNDLFINADPYEMQFAHYGGFAVLICTAWIFINRYITMNKQMQLAQVNERNRIARDLHDEVGPRLTEIKMVSENIKEKITLAEDEIIILDELSLAAEKVVSTLSEIVWALNPTNDTLEEFGSYLSQRAINFLQKADIRCRIDIPPVLPDKKTSYEMRRNILMIMNEVLNNIVKHADASIVTIQLSVKKDDLFILITDDGRGFDIDNIRKYGNGLKNIERRIKSIDGKYSIETKISAGTAIKMEVPLSFNHLFEKE